MKCKYCGKNIIEGAKYCVYCAKPVEEETDNKENSKKVNRSNNNSTIVIVLIILLVIIIFGGGFFVYKNYVVKSDKQVDNTKDIVEEPIKEETKIPEITKDEAKKLVDKYYYTKTSPNLNLFTTEMTIDQKKVIAIKNIDKSKIQTVNCEELSDFSKDIDGVCKKKDDKTITTQGQMLEYDVLNNEYKYLFGKNENVDKKDFEALLTTWKYNSDKNIFIDYNKIGGYISGPYYTTYAVKDFNQNGENLIINVGYVFMEPKDVNNSIVLSTTIGSQEITYKEEETKAPTFEADFLMKYIGLLDTYEFTFKYEDDHYIFVDMKKI